MNQDFRLTVPAIIPPSELKELVGQILASSGTVIPADAANDLRLQHVKLASLHVSLGIAVGKSQTSNPLTLAKAAADEKRDRAWVRLRDGVEGIHDDADEVDPALKEAAALLHNILAHHPAGLHRLGLAAETAQIDTLLPKLQAAPAAAALTALGLGPVVTRLQEGNDEYKAAVTGADQIDGDTAPQDWRTAAPVRWLASHFLSGIAFRAIEDAAYRPLLGELTDALTDSSSVARARRTRRDAGDAPTPA